MIRTCFSSKVLAVVTMMTNVNVAASQLPLKSGKKLSNDYDKPNRVKLSSNEREPQLKFYETLLESPATTDTSSKSAE